MNLPAAIAPFVLARVAGWPLDELIETSPPRTTAIIEAVVAARLEADALRSAVEVSLHSAIPLVNPRSRVAALALRRAVHNSRPCAAADLLRRDLAAVLPSAEVEALRRWLDLRKEIDDGLRNAEAVHEEDVQSHVRPAVRRLVGRDEFLRPLVIASRSLYEQTVRNASERPTGASATKAERALLSYLARASAKTSPFSTFMHLAVLESSGDSHGPPPLDADDRTSRTSLNRGLIFAIRRAAWGCCGDRRHASFVTNPAITWTQDGTVAATAPQFGVVNNRLLRLFRRVRLRLRTDLSRCVSRLPASFSWDELIDALAGAGAPRLDAEQLSIKLYDYGVIELAPWIDAFEPDPESSGRQKIDACTTTAARDLSTTLSSMRGHADAMRTADAGHRAALLVGLDADVGRAADWVQADVVHFRRNPVIEDGYFLHPGGAIGSALRGIFEEVAGLIQSRIEPCPQYQSLRDLYVELYGLDGVCYDVVDFLSRAATTLSQARDRSSRAGTMQAPRRRAVPVTVFLQIIAGDRSGDESMTAVINETHVGCGWLSARHGVGDSPFHEALRVALRTWLADLAAPAEPIDVLISGDCNPLQAHPRLTPHVLRCPLEPCLDPGALTLRDVQLRCNPGSGLIEMFAGTTVLAPTYLGTTFPNPAWGPNYWLTVLGAPWRLMPFERPAIEERDEGVTFFPRRVEGHIVVARATWHIPTDRLRQVWFRHRGATRTVEVAFDCARLGIPRFFFVRRLPSADATLGERSKPMWIDSRNPFMLDVLENLLGTARRVSIAEALPDRGSWPSLAGRCHVAELHVEMAL